MNNYRLFEDKPKIKTIQEFSDEELKTEYIFWQTKRESMFYARYQRRFLMEFEKRGLTIPGEKENELCKTQEL